MISNKIIKMCENHGLQIVYTGIIEGRDSRNAAGNIARKEEVYLLKGKTNFLLFKQYSKAREGKRKYCLMTDGKILYQSSTSVRDAVRNLDAILEEYD